MITKPNFVIRAIALWPGARRISNWLAIRNADDESQPVELLIYNQIGKDWFDDSGIDAKTFAETLQGIDRRREITVAINSPGGNVWDGLSMFHLLQARRDKVTIRIDGVAASIASVIAMAGKETRMPKSALLMIHRASGLAIGNAEVMRKLADELEKHDEVLAGIYADKAGGTSESWLKAMADETWYTGQEALSEGLADTLTDDDVSVTACASHFDFSSCRRVPAALQPQQTNNKKPMNRALIIALLKRHGVTVPDDASDQVIVAELARLVAAGKVTADQRKALVEPAASQPTPPTPTPAPAAPQPASSPAPAPSNVVAVDPQEFARMRQQLATERNARITTQFDAICAANPLINREQWLPRVLADETLMDNLRSFPMPAPGTEPLRASVTNNGNPLIEDYRRQRHGQERNEFRLRNFEAIQRVHREFTPRAANTMDAALVTDWLADGIIVVANNKLAPLAAFSRDFSTDPLKPRATVQVRKATGTSAAQSNPTNFETGDTTLDNIPVTVNQVNKSFHVSNAELNQGFRLAHLAQINANTFVNAISDIWTALIVAGTYTNVFAAIGASTSFDTGVLADIYGAAKNFNQKNLVLDGAYIGRLIPTALTSYQMARGSFASGAFGYDLIAEQNRWTAATANTVGIVCGPDGLAVASGLPIAPPNGEFLSLTNETIEPLGLVIQIATWYSRAGRVNWASYDVMLGAAPGDVTQLTLLKSA